MKKRNQAEITAEPRQRNSTLPIAFILAIVLAIIVYIVMLNFQKNYLKEYEKVPVLVTKAEVAKNLVINENNASELFEFKEIDVSIVPKSAICEFKNIYDMISYFKIAPGIVICEDMFYTLDDLFPEIDEVREIGLQTPDVSNIANGILRAGDFVDIYIIERQDEVMNNDNPQLSTYKKKLDPLYENVYISCAFDSAGEIISVTDTTTPCNKINIIMSKNDASLLLNSLQNGTLFITKITDKDKKTGNGEK